MRTSLIGFLLGACRHLHQSRPFTLENDTYKVCLDCGKKIQYSLERMAPLRLKQQRRLKSAKG
jgi:RNA polymerase-binding transcription factor DksA